MRGLDSDFPLFEAVFHAEWGLPLLFSVKLLPALQGSSFIAMIAVLRHLRAVTFLNQFVFCQ
jgi:hypothetical protein